MAKLTRDNMAKLAVACTHFGVWKEGRPMEIGKLIKKKPSEAGAILKQEVVDVARRDLPTAIARSAKIGGVPSGTKFVDVDWVAIVIDKSARERYLSADGVNAKNAAQWLRGELSKVDEKFVAA
jgi:hypothetical protein